jgi:tetratricopeptide (TPR) repeat protein
MLLKMLNKKILIGLIPCIVLFMSCAGKSAIRLETLVNATSSNDFLPAIEQIKKNPKMYGKTNSLLYYMDIGVLFHYAGLYDSSNVYLLKAADIYNDLFARSVTNEAAAFLVNDNVRPYRSKPYELVMMHQIMGLNFFSQNNVENALVETRRTQLLFNEWERKARTDEKYTTDGMFHYISSVAYDAKGDYDDAMISLFKSVEAFQKGAVPLVPEIQNYAYYMFLLNNRPDDNKLLSITASANKENIQGLANGESEIIVIGYAGRGPIIDEKVWWGTYIKDGLLVLNFSSPDGQVETMSMVSPGLPERDLQNAEKGKKTESGTTFHIKVALPVIKTNISETDVFSVYCSGKSQPVKTIIINDLDKQLEKYLNDTKGTTIARTVARVVLRTIAAEKAKDQMQTNNGIANLLVNLGTDLLTDQMERADTRTCFLLPKTVQICRIPVTPGTYSVDINALNKGGTVLNGKKFGDIRVGPGEKKFILYSSLK